MTDKPKPSTKKKSFPIRNFARLLDEFLIEHFDGPIGEGDKHNLSIRELLQTVDAALVEHAKR